LGDLRAALAHGDTRFRASIEPSMVAVTLEGLMRLLLSVTLGNVIGGGVLVALVYWLVYLRPKRR